jgi:hypothetical protein
MMDAWLQDVRFGVRTLFCKPGFAVAAILTLALGIGGNTAVFSVVNSVLLRPLPFSTSDRIVWVWGREFNGQPAASVSPPDFQDYVRGVDAFERLAAFSAFSSRRVYEDGDRPIELLMRSVTHDLLPVLGQSPALGRGFTEEETLGEIAEVMMISHGLWGRLFGFDEAVIGRVVRILGADTRSSVCSRRISTSHRTWTRGHHSRSEPAGSARGLPTSCVPSASFARG